MKFTDNFYAVQRKIGDILTDMYWYYDEMQGMVFEFEVNNGRAIYWPTVDNVWEIGRKNMSDDEDYESLHIKDTITNESLYVIQYLFEYYDDSPIYETLKNLSDGIDIGYGVKELDFNKIADGILEIREGLKRKFPDAEFTYDADKMVKGFRNIQYILDNAFNPDIENILKKIK